MNRRVIAAVCTSLVVLLPGACSRTNAPAAHGANDSIAGADSAHKQTDSVRNQSLAGSILAREDSLSYEQHQGKYLYRKYCVVCHGEEGKGDGFNAYNLDPKPRDFTDAKIMGSLTDEKIIQTIAGGGRSVNRSPLMPSWGGRLEKEEMRYILAYVRWFGSASR
jgi:mono/diheme cytochrome c family protein